MTQTRISVYNLRKGGVPMTTAELVRLLKKNGCIFIGHNKRHDMYRSPITGNTFMVGRHPSEEVRTGTLHKILRDAGISIR